MERKETPRRSPILVWALICLAIVLVFFVGWNFSSPDQTLIVVPTAPSTTQ
jgi:hypothetical protein